MRRYAAHGLHVDSDVELSLPAGDPDGRSPDLVLRTGPARAIPSADPPGTAIARLVDDGGALHYVLGRDGDRTVLRYPGLCEFVGGATLSDVTAHLHPGLEPGIVPVLAAGALLAVHLRLRRELVLHASSVSVGSRAVAFVGASGMGKSTMATLLCAEGHSLVTDDVLRVAITPAGVAVHAGSTETRLRPAARDLTSTVEAGAVRCTADGRLAVRPRRYGGEPLPLAACVIPLPDRERDRVAVTVLTGAHALLRLTQLPRVLGWLDKAGRADDFRNLSALVSRVPVVEARIPWGPPFAPDIGAQLLDAIGLVAQR